MAHELSKRDLARLVRMWGRPDPGSPVDAGNGQFRRDEVGVLVASFQSALQSFGLTPANRDVAARMFFGESIEEIADARKSSDRTVTTQRTEIYKGLGVSCYQGFHARISSATTRILMRRPRGQD
jgi:DNA-binding NarL/FixJ family response regulator